MPTIPVIVCICAFVRPACPSSAASPLTRKLELSRTPVILPLSSLYVLYVSETDFERVSISSANSPIVLLDLSYFCCNVSIFKASLPASSEFLPYFLHTSSYCLLSFSSPLCISFVPAVNSSVMSAASLVIEAYCTIPATAPAMPTPAAIHPIPGTALSAVFAIVYALVATVSAVIDAVATPMAVATDVTAATVSGFFSTNSCVPASISAARSYTFCMAGFKVSPMATCKFSDATDIRCCENSTVCVIVWYAASVAPAELLISPSTSLYFCAPELYSESEAVPASELPQRFESAVALPLTLSPRTCVTSPRE